MPGAARPGRLLLTIHHLAVDGVSWRILVPDLAAAWQAVGGGQAVALPARGTSFRRWAQRLAAHAQDASVAGGAAVLERRCRAAVAAAGEGAARSGARHARHGRASDADAAGRGDGGAADAGAGGVPWRHQRRAADRACACGGGLVPAAGAGRAASARGGSHAVLLDLEGHGRRRCSPERRSVAHGGLVHQPLSGAAGSGAARSRRRRWRAGRRWAGRSRPIKEQLRAVPGNGLGYGLLRYLNARDGGAACRAAGAAARLQLSGPVRGRRRRRDWRRRLGAGDGEGDAARRRRRSGDAAGACDRDQRADAGWGRRPAAYGAPGPGRRRCSARRRCAIWRSAGSRALAALARHAAQPGAGGRTPSDLPLVALTQGEIERLERRYPRDRGHPAAVAAAGGSAVPCALRRAGARTSTRCSSCSI